MKETLFRTVLQDGDAIGSTAVTTDAWRHRSDAITSAAAFIGIALAFWAVQAGSPPAIGPRL